MSKFMRPIANLSVGEPKAWDKSLWNLYGHQTLSGETVNEETALTYSAVWCAVMLLSGTIASLPLHLMKVEDKNRLPADDDPLYRVMHDQANEFMSAMQFRDCMMAHILTWGNGYAEKVCNLFGEVRELWPIPPNRVLRMEMFENDLWYQIRIPDTNEVKNEVKWLPRKQILHIPGLGFDGFSGYSPIAMARKSIGLGMALESFGSLFFGQGTHPGTVVSHPRSLSPDAHQSLQASLEKAQSGLGRSHRLLLLEEGMKIEKLGIPPEESQFLETRQFEITEIARWYNLPPHKLKDLTKSSFNNIEEEQLSFVGESVLPWLVRLEQAYNHQILTRDQAIRRNYYFKHVVEGLLRADAEARGKFYQFCIQNAIMTPNEARVKEDMNPSNNPLADELWMMSNVVPLSNYDNEMEAQRGTTDVASAKSRQKNR